MRNLKLIVGGVVLVGGCAYVGFTDLAEAMRTGGSTRNGIETLVVGAILGAILGVLIYREARRMRG